ncbi:MAG: hypothetical protein DWQ01_15265 [Planctomycetota bacterium]|nr:MAG: hypothetical protein DWQ01_15265 [Planctomycetota bacterium]
MRIGLLVNPRSGRGKARSFAPLMETSLRRRGHRWERLDSQDEAEAIRWVAERASDFERLLVLGGDGSLNAALNGLPEQPPPTGLVPLGSSNLLGREMKLPKDPDTVTTMLETGRVLPLDVGLLSSPGLGQKGLGPEGNQRRSFLCFDCGYGGELMRRMEDIRQRKSGTVFRPLYYPLIFKMFWDWKPKPQRVIADGEELGVFPYVIASSVRSYASPHLILGPTWVNDGYWDLYAMNRAGFWRLLPVAMRGMLSQVEGSPRVLHRRVRHLKVEGQPSELQIDGDFAGASPVEFQVTDFRLPLVLPADAPRPDAVAGNDLERL